MNNRKTKKGFTLTEMVIVLTIIGVLSAILIPAWNYFMRKAHERDATAKAKVVFNAAQTEITRIGMRERPFLNKANDSSLDSTERLKASQQLYVGQGDFYFYWDGNNGVMLDPADGITEKDTVKNAANNAKLAKAINSITGGNGFYKIYVKDYNVQSVMYADMSGSNYKGTYPVTMSTLEDNDVDVSTFRHGSVKDADLSSFTLAASP